MLAFFRHLLMQKDQQIKELQDKLENIALKAVSQPRTVNNNNSKNINTIVNNLKPIEPNHFVEQAQFLTIEHIKKGLPGYVEYAIDHSFKDRVVCVDYARRKIKFKDDKGNVITDPEMVKLAPMFFEAIKDKSKALTLTWGDELKEHIGEEIFQKVIDGLDMSKAISEGSERKKSDFFHDFVKYVCSNNMAEE